MNAPLRKVIDTNTQYLDGPNSRGSEFKFTLKVAFQLLKGFRKLHFVGPCITVFGSARIDSGHEDYDMAMNVGSQIAKLGFTTMTGGGPGIMEAANRGAFNAGGNSVGCTIKLPHEQSFNKFMHKVVKLDYFFVRKVLLLKYSYAFVVMPGGFGTLDELFETATLIQTGIIQNFPIVVYDTEYYGAIRKLIEDMIRNETISESDRELILFTNDVQEGMQHIRKYISHNYLVKSKRNKPLWWLGE